MLRQFKWLRQFTHDRASNHFTEPTWTPAVKVAKKIYFSASISSASSHMAQLLRCFKNWTPWIWVPRILESYFLAVTILRLSLKIKYGNSATTWLSALFPVLSWNFCVYVKVHFNQCSPADIDRILLDVKLTTCSLDPCPSLLVESCCQIVGSLQREIINFIILSPRVASLGP